MGNELFITSYLSIPTPESISQKDLLEVDKHSNNLIEKKSKDDDKSLILAIVCR